MELHSKYDPSNPKESIFDVQKRVAKDFTVRVSSWWRLGGEVVGPPLSKKRGLVGFLASTWRACVQTERGAL